MSGVICVFCGRLIDPERLEILPDTRRCIECARKFPEPPKHDPNVVCAIGSVAGRNGFVKSD